MKIAMWLPMGLFIYPYILYPIIIKSIAYVVRRGVRRAGVFPTVTIVIAAYNEEQNIERTLVNKIALNYPKDKLDIIVVSDASTDSTNEIVRKVASDRVALMCQGKRQGKAACLNAAVSVATGEVIVFSDANTLYDKNAVRYMVENFADPTVGYITGSLVSVRGGDTLNKAGADRYMRYEEFLRKAETEASSIVGVNGGVDAIRRSLYRDVDPDLITDFVLPLSVQDQGYRVVFDPRVIAVEEPNSNTKDELRMRTRVAVRAWRGIFAMRHMINPFTSPYATFTILSHKVIRYLSPFFLLTMLLANVYLAIGESGYRILLGVHLFIYVLAGIGMLRTVPAIVRKATVIPAYLAITNMAFLIAFVKILKGEKMAVWRPRAG